MKYKRIDSLDQYNVYCDRHEELTFEDYEKHKDEIELIQILIDEYDSRMTNYSREMNPVELLKYILTEDEISSAELARDLDVSKQLISDILNYKRNISKIMVMKLADRFKMMPSAFSRTYKLKNYRKPKAKPKLKETV